MQAWKTEMPERLDDSSPLGALWHSSQPPFRVAPRGSLEVRIPLSGKGRLT